MYTCMLLWLLYYDYDYDYIYTVKKEHDYDYNHNETPTVRGLAADNNNKLYIETMIFLWNKHYNLNFIM